MEGCEKKKSDDIFSNLLMLLIIAIVGGSSTEISRYLICFKLFPSEVTRSIHFPLLRADSLPHTYPVS